MWQERRGSSGQKTGGSCLLSQGRRRQAPRQRWRAACSRAGARAGAGGSTGDSEPAPDGLSLSAADGGRYTCVHAPAATGQPPASASSGSGDQQLSDSQQPTTTVTNPISRANTMYTSAFPVDLFSCISLNDMRYTYIGTRCNKGGRSLVAGRSQYVSIKLPGTFSSIFSGLKNIPV